MLILSRKKGESFFVGDDVEITISEISKDKVKVVINAPKDIIVLRKELKELKSTNEQAALTSGDVNYIKNIFKK